MTGPRAEYDRRVSAGALQRDRAQAPAINELERLYHELIASQRTEGSLVGKLRQIFRRPPEPVRGVYLYGDVGRGKTLLMDIFYHSLPFKSKRRLHFHRFMASIHAELANLTDAENPLDIVAARIAASCKVICFDEFFVSDIADAMVLGNLFTALFAQGVTLAATSNIEPKYLYQDGLQRQRFLKAIDAIEVNTVVIRLAGEQDYRLRYLEQEHVFITPADRDADSRLQHAFAAIAPDDGDRNDSMDILGRPIEFRRRSDGVVWFRFDAICDGPRSQDDYIELAREFQTVIVSGIPQFSVELENQARRFIALVDEFYDRKVKLIVSADAAVDELYAGSRLVREFERTRSRLIEMQSRDYLAAAHKP